MWELDYKESWVLKNWCFWTVVLEKILESPLGCKEIKAVNLQGNQFWIFIGKTDVEAEAPILWPPDAKNWLIGKDPDDGKEWRYEEKRMTEDEMIGWNHRLNGHQFEQGLGIWQGDLTELNIDGQFLMNLKQERELKCFTEQYMTIHIFFAFTYIFGMLHLKCHWWNNNGKSNSISFIKYFGYKNVLSFGPKLSPLIF